MTDKIRTVAYWRVSRKEGEDKSIPDQKKFMRPKCKLQGVEIVPGGEFEDEAISGTGMKKRDAFQEMLAFCQAKHAEGEPVQAIVMWKSDRFSRADSNETGHYIWQFRLAGVNRVITFAKEYDWRKREDRAIFNLEQDFTNNAYSANLSQNVTRGKLTNAEAGFSIGGMVPFGFERVIVDGEKNIQSRVHRREKIGMRRKDWRVVLSPVREDDPDPDRQLERQTVLWLFDTFARQTVSFSHLCKLLNERGVPGPGSHYHYQTSRPGQFKWSPSSVRGILSNPVYAGTARVGYTGKGQFWRIVDGKEVEVQQGEKRTERNAGAIMRPLPFGGLVNKETWELVQRKVAERCRKSNFARGDGKYFIPSGILFCGQCGLPMYGCVHRPRGHEYRKYVCSAPNVKPGTCKHYSIHEHQLVKVLVRKVLDEYTAPERLEGLKRELTERTAAKHDHAPAEIERIKKRVDQLEREAQSAAQLVIRFPENAVEYNAALTALRAQRDRAVKELAAAERCKAVPLVDATAQVDRAIDALKELRADLGTAYQKGDRGRLRELFSRMVSRVDLYFKEVEKIAQPAAKSGKKRVENRPKQRYTFVKGIIKTRPVLDVKGNGAHLK